MNSAAMDRTTDADWETATWEGARRAHLRAALALTVRERLQALEDLARLSERLVAMPRKQGAEWKEKRAPAA